MKEGVNWISLQGDEARACASMLCVRRESIMKEIGLGNWPVLLIYGESCLLLLGKGVSISALESRAPMAKSS